MSEPKISPLQHLEFLSRIFPVKGAVVVGAGQGEGAWFDLLQKIDVQALLIEAGAERVKHLEKMFADHAGWIVQQHVVAAEQRESFFYDVANSSESSLLPPDMLPDLWPHIKLKQKQACQTVPLDELFSQTDFAANWLILDCLPALPLLQGAEAVLSGVDVAIVRLIADNELCPGTHAIHHDIESFMQGHGFCCFGLEPERHPALAHAVYLRDYAGLVRQQQINAENERNKLNQQLKSEREDYRAVKKQLGEAEKQLQLALQRVQESDAVKKELIAARDDLSTQLGEQVQQLEDSRNENEQQAAQLKQRDKDLNASRKKQTEQEAERDKLCQQLDDEQKKYQAVKQKLEEQLFEETASHQSLQAEKAELEKELETAKKHANELKKNAEQSQQALEQAQQELEKKAGALNAKAQAEQESRKETERAKKQLAAQQNQIHQQTKEYIKERDTLKVSMAELKEQNQAKKQQIAQLKHDLELTKTEGASAAKKQQEQIRALIEANAEVARNAAEAVQMLNVATQARDELQEQNSALQKQVNELIQRKADLESRLGEQEQQIAQFKQGAQNVELAEQIKKQNDHLVQVRNQLEGTFKKEVANATLQIEVFLGIQDFFRNGELLPSMHGWPISPDFAYYLIGLINRNDYDIIIEFGSGTSTFFIAKTLDKIAKKRKKKFVTVQIAFEHLEQYHAKTSALLQQAGLETAVQLVLAPIQTHKSSNGHSYPYYSCQETLAKLAQKVSASRRKILLVVDGPPSNTGRHARYPALPVVLSEFENVQIDILLDDFARQDEKEIAAKWEQILDKKNLVYQAETIPSEKGMYLCRIGLNQDYAKSSGWQY